MKLCYRMMKLCVEYGKNIVTVLLQGEDEELKIKWLIAAIIFSFIVIKR